MASAIDIHDFITESNMIESIHAKPGEPLYDQHEAALHHAIEMAEDDKDWPRPVDLHSILMRATMDSGRGRYRHEVVTVGVTTTPKPEIVPQLMHAWTKSAQQFLDRRAKDLSNHEKRISCMRFHCWFECIHPFIDGNGRVGRLMWAYMQLRCDLHWGSFLKNAYYNSIHEWRAGEWDKFRLASLSRGEAHV